MFQFIENQGYFKINSCIQKGAGRVVGGNPLSYYKAEDVLKYEGHMKAKK